MRKVFPPDIRSTVNMVSHAEIPESTRRASSVAPRSRSQHSQARSQRSHSHHRNRSHYGGAQYAPQNEFPFFTQTGDVEVVIKCDGQEKRYLLHRLILAQFSGFFAAGMNDEWSRSQQPRLELQSFQDPQRLVQRVENALSVIGEETSSSLSAPAVAPEQIQRSPTRLRWRYELDWENVQDDEEPMLVQKVINSRAQRTPADSVKPPSPNGIFVSSFMPPPPNRPPPANAVSRPSFFRSMANLSLGHHGPASQSVANIVSPQPIDPALSNPLLRDYDNLFRIFYNHAPVLNTANIASAYSECKSLLNVADMYDALLVVGPRIDHHLLRFSSKLFKQIAKYPPSYLKLGYLARSRIIFSEALTHVVGQWPAAYPYLKPSEPPVGGYEVPITVLDLIEDKVDELEEMKSKVESKLFRLTLTTSRGERVNPSNDYLGWLAMSLFRQWLAENTTPEIRGILKNTPNTANSRDASRPSSANNTSPGATRSNTQPTTRPAPPPSTGRIYRLLASTDSQTYLAHDELKRFLKLHPSATSSSSLYTRESLKRFERKMEELKNVARDIVKPLTRNSLELDIRALSDGGSGGLGYLTCMGVAEGEFPWD